MRSPRAWPADRARGGPRRTRGAACLAAEAAAAEPVIRDRSIADGVATRIEAARTPSLRKVFNLTGTVLHTNLGRAPLPRQALEAIAEVATARRTSSTTSMADGAASATRMSNRGCSALTGGAAATVVNNNAAALTLVLNTLALRKEVPVSRGELVEIGGGFRLPTVMARAGCRLVEVGTTNRTHLADYTGAIGPKTALLLKVHCEQLHDPRLHRGAARA
jgi:L-seryl-tRNA(Ser) seleniumtransferase